MKRQFDTEKLRKDTTKLSDKEFETKYPGVKRKVTESLSDIELIKVVGGGSSVRPRP